jgi:hypothetical protein
LISAASGGSSAEQWIDPSVLRSIGIEDTGESRGTWGGLHQEMIRPLVPFAIRGVIWYQGESNTTRFVWYQEVMTALIESWRQEWGQGEFPFYFVQLARQGKGGGSLHFSEGWPSLRDAQRRTLTVPNTGMAVSFDVSDGNTHPPDKKSIAFRLARIARAREYDEAIEDSGPMYKSIEWGDGRATLHFDHAEGMHARGDRVDGFLIGGLNTGFRTVEAKVVGETVVIAVPPDSDPRISEVRYAWGKYPEANLYNAAGLPASPFSTVDKLTESERLISQREVQALVRAVILATTPEKVRDAAGEVDDYVTDNDVRLRELQSFTQMLVGSKPFAEGRYGIPEARVLLKQWAEVESP